MAKRKLPKEVYCEISDDEFYFDFLNTDFDIENDNQCFENIYTNDFDSE